MKTPQTISSPSTDPLNATVRLAKSEDEIKRAQELRYEVFYNEYKAKPTEEMKREKRDFDALDNITDHLIVLITPPGSDEQKIIGTYRLLRQDVARKHNTAFYSSQEYEIEKLISAHKNVLELGRSCVLAEYRTKPILNMLWQGIAEYFRVHDIDLLFGCASFAGTDVDTIKDQLSYLHHYHSTPNEISPKAVPSRYVNMNITPKESLNEKRIFASLPPLIKGYIRAGATIGEGAVIDEQFNTIDVCIVVRTQHIPMRYMKHYDRKNQKNTSGQEN